jgi:hypothetical protein
MFAKLTSTKLTPMRVLRQARPALGPGPMLYVAPVHAVAPEHANDNHVARASSAGARGRPALTCRWFTTAAGRLECRWFLADCEAGDPDEPGGAARHMKRPVALGGRRFALVTD